MVHGPPTWGGYENFCRPTVSEKEGDAFSSLGSEELFCYALEGGVCSPTLPLDGCC
jgi:hypothetical protein